MSQLSTLKSLLGNPPENDVVLQFYLDNASEIICDIRNSHIVEDKYLTTQVKMAIELFSKRGAEGQTGHGENGISRSYEKGDVSESLLRQVIPMVKTPFSDVRIV